MSFENDECSMLIREGISLSQYRYLGVAAVRYKDRQRVDQIQAWEQVAVGAVKPI